MRRRAWWVWVTMAALVGGFSIVSAKPAQAIAAIDLGTLGGAYSVASVINDFGVVAGTSATASGEEHVFRWTAHRGMQDLGSLGGGSSRPTGINRLGQLVGWSEDSTFRPRAFRWAPNGGMQDLGVALPHPSESGPLVINSKGQIAGSALDPDGRTRAFRWTPAGGLEFLGSLGGNEFQAWAMNDRGHVVGFSSVATGLNHAFLWTPSAGMQDLGTLGGEHGGAIGIKIAARWLATRRWPATLTFSVGPRRVGCRISALSVAPLQWLSE